MNADRPRCGSALTARRTSLSPSSILHTPLYNAAGRSPDAIDSAESTDAATSASLTVLSTLDSVAGIYHDKLLASCIPTDRQHLGQHLRSLATLVHTGVRPFSLARNTITTTSPVTIIEIRIETPRVYSWKDITHEGGAIPRRERRRFAPFGKQATRSCW